MLIVNLHLKSLMGSIIVLSVILIAVLTVIFYKRAPKKALLPATYKDLLSKTVGFYRSLDETEKLRFEEKIKKFLAYVRITGVGTNVEDIDRLLVASSAVIPIFGFPEWKYYNLREVLLYPETFDREEFLSTNNRRDTLGMVGNGPMQRVMILSKPALHSGFINTQSMDNTGIHEFVHLIDKDDGDVDGLPEALLTKQYMIPWLNLMNENIQSIIEGNSDINIYGATNKAEFFAVAAEYFFKRPDMFKEKHKELYNLMSQIFQQTPPLVSE